MTEKKTAGGIRGAEHKERIGATNHARFVEKFDHALLAKMQAMRADGAELGEIAEATGKSMSTVSRWLRNGCERRQNAAQGKSRQRGKPYLKAHGYVCLTINGRAVYQRPCRREGTRPEPAPRRGRASHQPQPLRQPPGEPPCLL